MNELKLQVSVADFNRLAGGNFFSYAGRLDTYAVPGPVEISTESTNGSFRMHIGAAVHVQWVDAKCLWVGLGYTSRVQMICDVEARIGHPLRPETVVTLMYFMQEAP